MTTNITALAQRLKVAAKNGCCHTLFPDDCLALVEALEKAQQTEKTLESRNRRLDGIITAAEKHIADLESRAVTVENLQESAYRAGLTPGWNLGLANNNEGFNKCLAAHAAGIKVNFEGEQNTQPLSEAERAGPQERRKAERDTEPYGFTDGDRRGMIYKPEHSDRLSEPVPVYRHAQPAPVVPEEMTPEMMRAVQLNSELGAYAASNLSGAYDLFAEFWKVACRAAMLKEENATKWWHGLYNEIKGRGRRHEGDFTPDASMSTEEIINAINKRRDAMLQELKKSAGTEATCRSNENAQVLTSINPAPDLVSLQKKAESIIGNYPGIPDGYVMVPDDLKEAAADLLATLDDYPEQLVPINRDSSVVRALRAAMLVAAPQEE
ncbi:hypothetical protein [Klebsiella pneumoniae]|uniref:hypothetical protein n=1 Tax=Klebsiella pneumoniae TaxID=573 RepID=UPI00069CDDCB|nr:hypothetical protein [Klebsiella pneumoniae]